MSEPAAHPATSAPSAGLGENHRRSLSAGLQHIADLLAEAETALAAGRGEDVFERTVNDLSPAEAGVVRDYLERIRRAMRHAAERHALDGSGGRLGARKSVAVRALAAGISVEEMRAKRLRGYGALSPETAAEVERTCDELARAIRDLEAFLRGGPEEEYERRLARLAATGGGAELLAALERVIREEGLVEYRPLLASILERLEERSFHVAVFGRVSSGKSSLLNALLGADVLPVGVTPVTSVPTRVRVGQPPLVRVKLASGESETVSLEGLHAFASEEENPGNVKRVARLELVYPVPELPEGVELVDTPGIGSLATTGTAETVAYLPRTDLAVLLVDVGSSIGPDEIGLLRLFATAAIPVEVLLSKADLVDEAALAKLSRYVGEVVAREAGMKPAVRAVSALGQHRRRVREWADERLKPLFSRRAELAAESARRITGRLLERVVATLEQRLGGSADTVDRDTVREEARLADARIAEARSRVERLCDEMPSRWKEPFAGTAIEVVALWNGGAPSPADVTPLLATELTREADRARDLVVAELRALEEALRASAAKVDPASAELLSEKPRGSLRSLLAGIPVLDAEAVVAAAAVAKARRPLLASASPRHAARRLALRLMDRAGTPVKDALRTYGYRLRDFAVRAVDSLADSYHAAVGATLGAPVDAAEAGDEARRRIEAALRELRALQEKNVRGRG